MEQESKIVEHSFDTYQEPCPFCHTLFLYQKRWEHWTQECPNLPPIFQDLFQKEEHKSELLEKIEKQKDLAEWQKTKEDLTNTLFERDHIITCECCHSTFPELFPDLKDRHTGEKVSCDQAFLCASSIEKLKALDFRWSYDLKNREDLEISLGNVLTEQEKEELKQQYEEATRQYEQNKKYIEDNKIYVIKSGYGSDFDSFGQIVAYVEPPQVSKWKLEEKNGMDTICDFCITYAFKQGWITQGTSYEDREIISTKELESLLDSLRRQFLTF